MPLPYTMHKMSSFPSFDALSDFLSSLPRNTVLKLPADTTHGQLAATIDGLPRSCGIAIDESFSDNLVSCLEKIRDSHIVVLPGNVSQAKIISSLSALSKAGRCLVYLIIGQVCTLAPPHFFQLIPKHCMLEVYFSPSFVMAGKWIPYLRAGDIMNMDFMFTPAQFLPLLKSGVKIRINAHSHFLEYLEYVPHHCTMLMSPPFDMYFLQRYFNDTAFQSAHPHIKFELNVIETPISPLKLLSLSRYLPDLFGGATTQEAIIERLAKSRLSAFLLGDMGFSKEVCDSVTAYRMRPAIPAGEYPLTPLPARKNRK